MKNNFLGKNNHFKLLTYGKENCLVKERDKPPDQPYILKYIQLFDMLPYDSLFSFFQTSIRRPVELASRDRRCAETR